LKKFVKSAGAATLIVLSNSAADSGVGPVGDGVDLEMLFVMDVLVAVGLMMALVMTSSIQAWVMVPMEEIRGVRRMRVRIGGVIVRVRPRTDVVAMLKDTDEQKKKLSLDGLEAKV
jgi:hypothetical protein